MNILFVCTSNQDRSPALQKYFSDNYPHHNFSSAGINKYFTEKKGTTYITEVPIVKYDIIVFAEQIHRSRFHEIYESEKYYKISYVSDSKIKITIMPEEQSKEIKEIVLALGNYQQGCIGEDYLIRAEQILKPYLK